MLDFSCHFDLLLIARTVYLGNEGFENGRTRRHLGYLDPRSVAVANLHKPRTQAFRNGMALRSAFVAVVGVELGVRPVCSAPPEVMPHQSVEVVGPRCACIDLVVRYFMLLSHIAA